VSPLHQSTMELLNARISTASDRLQRAWRQTVSKTWEQFGGAEEEEVAWRLAVPIVVTAHEVDSAGSNVHPTGNRQRVQLTDPKPRRARKESDDRCVDVRHKQ